MPNCRFQKNKISFDYPKIEFATSNIETFIFGPLDHGHILRVQTKIKLVEITIIMNA